MNTNITKTILALGGLTGVRSMAGLATLACTNGGKAWPLSAVALTGEMIADKSSLIGNRTDTIPLVGRAVLGAVVGALLASGGGSRDRVFGSMLGAASAVAAANLAYQTRKRLPLSNAAGGLLEDALVLMVASRYADTSGLFAAGS